MPFGVAVSATNPPAGVRVVVAAAVVVVVIALRLSESPFLAGAPISAAPAVPTLVVAPSVTPLLASRSPFVMRVLLVAAIVLEGWLRKAHREP